MAFVTAMITAYNSHISHDEAIKLAAKANHGDFMVIHRIALGLNDPKGDLPENGQDQTISQPNESLGVASSPG